MKKALLAMSLLLSSAACADVSIAANLVQTAKSTTALEFKRVEGTKQFTCTHGDYIFTMEILEEVDEAITARVNVAKKNAEGFFEIIKEKVRIFTLDKAAKITFDKDADSTYALVMELTKSAEDATSNTSMVLTQPSMVVNTEVVNTAALTQPGQIVDTDNIKPAC